MASLPSDIQGALVQLLGGLSSADNTIRSQAEESLNKQWTSKDRVGILLLFLADQSAHGSSDAAKSFAAVLFRRMAIKTPQDVKSVVERTITTIDLATVAQIRGLFLEGFVSAVPNHVRHKLADAIAELANDDIQAPWNELLPTLFQASKNPDASFRESAFRIFAACPQLVGKNQLEQVLSIYHDGFEDQSDDVRIAACTAFVGFFQNLPKKLWSNVEGLLPSLLNSLPRFLDNNKESALASVLESLIDLVELAPKMFKSMFETIIQFCSVVAKNTELDSSARLSALELLTTFAEASPTMCKHQPQYLEQIVVITLSLMTEVCIDDDDAAEWNNSSDNDDENEEPEYDSARQALDRVSLRLNGKYLAAPLFQIIPSMLSSANWKERQAALMALSSAAEGCRDVLITEIPKILAMILPSLNDPHPRVQYATCNALGQISTDFATTIQRTAGDQIIPALVSKLTNQSVPRVQAHAAAALVNFSENASKETLEPYLDDLLTNLLTLLQSPKRYVQEQVLTTIAIVADAAEQKFIKYYDTLMPLLINVLVTDMSEEHRMLKAKCIECSTLIAAAVGKEKFSQHSRELIQIFGTIQQGDLQEDDPVKPYLEQGWGRIARIIGKDFLPLLQIVLPPLLEAAKVTQNISLLEEDEAEEFSQNENWDVIQLHGKHIAVHTAVLDDKASAIDLINTYAEILKGDFYRYTKEIVIDILLPSLDFYLHDEVRRAAASALPSLLLTSKYANGEKSAETLELWNLMSAKLIKTIGTEPVQDLLFTYYSALGDCIEIIGQDSLSIQLLQSLATNLDSNLKEMYERIKDRENADDEYNEELEEEDFDYTDEELSDEINKLISIVFKSNKLNFLQVFQTLVPTVATYINDENSVCKTFGLCVAADLIEYTGSQSSIFQDLFLNPMGESLTSQQASVRQAAAYGVGVAALNATETYADFIIAALTPLFEMTQIPEARSEENVQATENASSTIAKAIHALGERIPNVNAVIEKWLTTLPILNDSEAAAFGYKFLSHLIENNHPSVKSQIPQVVDNVVQALIYQSIGGKTAESVVNATKSLLGSIPQDQAMSLLSRYPVESQQVIQKWFS